jgi:LysM repeat protein
VAGDLARGGFFSENITSGSNKSPAQAVLEWQRDAAHMNTMLSPNLQDAGAGVSVSEGVTYYTLVAGASSGSTVNYTPPAGGTPGDLGALPPLEIVQPVTTSTALEDGSVFHEVKLGQALWSIALAYGTTIDELKRLNQLANNEIYVGQNLLVRKEEAATGTPDGPTATVTIGVSTSTPTKRVTSTNTATPTPQPVPPSTRQSSGVIVIVIVFGALAAAGIGTWLSTKRSSKNEV